MCIPELRGFGVSWLAEFSQMASVAYLHLLVQWQHPGQEGVHTYSLHYIVPFLGFPFRILNVDLVKPEKGTAMDTIGRIAVWGDVGKVYPGSRDDLAGLGRLNLVACFVLRNVDYSPL